MWQTFPGAIQAFPHGTPLTQLGAAALDDAKASAATAARISERMASPL
jgi:hypothetical protein